MRLRHLAGPELTANLGRPRTQLGLEMTPLVEQFSASLRNAPLESSARNLGGVELVAAIHGLLRETNQKRGNGGVRIGLRLKTNQLWMMPVTLGRAGENFLGKQRLTPSRHQPFRIQITRMQCP